MSNRRTNKVAGYVKFPVDSTEYVSTEEGGMFVRLVSVPSEDRDLKESVCCGGTAGIVHDEVFVGDDTTTSLEKDDVTAIHKIAHEKAHFPNIDNETAEGSHRYFSIEYNAVILMGSTGWSGSSDKDGYWICKYDDLTEEGKRIYDSIKELYPHSQNCLQTWLDT